MASYGIARAVRYGPFVADRRFASRGIVPGCSLATTFAKLYMVRGMDKLVVQLPKVTWNVFIDDGAAASTGTPEAIAEEVADAVEALRTSLRADGCELAPAKT